MEGMKVRDLMTKSVVTLRPGSSLREAAETLLEHRVSGAPVVDADERLVGIVTEGDLLPKEAGTKPHRSLAGAVSDLAHLRRGAGGRKLRGTTVRDLMTTDVYTVAPDDPVRAAARLLLKHELRRLPVVDDGRVVGVISRHDVIQVFHRPDDELEAAARRVLDRCLFLPPDHTIHVSVQDGVATLRGTVRYNTDIDIAAAIVRDVDGIVDARSELGFRMVEPRMVYP